MSKARSTGNLNNSIVISDTGAITFVSGSTTLATLNTAGQLSGSTPVVFAATSSFANAFTVAGTLTAQTLVVQTITSSVDFVTGSTRFGSLSSNNHTFTGSVLVTGSATVTGQGTFNSPSSLAIIANGPAALSQASPNTYSLGIGNGGGYDLTLGTTSSVAIIQSWSNKPLVLNPVGNNVGIGTNNPSTKFEVSGTIGSFQIASSGAEIFLTRNENNDILATGGTSSGITIGAQSYVRFSVGTSYTERMRISSNGTLTSYGTFYQSPSSGTGGFYIDRGSSSTSPYISWINGSGTRLGYMGYSNTNVGLYLENSAAFTVTGGNVGIGTASPGCRLDLVGGNMALNDNKLLIRFASDGNHSLEFNSSYNGPFLFGYTGAALGYRGTGVIWTSNTNYFNYGNTTTWNQTSDIRAKQNINTITNAIDKITLLNPVTFDYTDEFASQRSWADKHKLNNVGFIAQEYENVFPDDVNEVEEKIGDVTYEDFKTINTTSIVPYLVKAIQELKAENDTLKEILQRNNIQ